MTFVGKIRDVVARNSGRTALTYADREWTFGELDSAARRIARRIASQGVLPGERVAMMLSNGPRLVACHLSNILAGRVSMLLNTAYREHEISAMTAIGRPKIAVIDSGFAPLWRRSTIDRTVTLSPIDHRTIDEPRDPDDAACGDGEFVESADSTPAALIFTSGTTGRPKAAILTHGMMAASIDALEDAWALSIEDHLLLTLPLFHVHGLCVGVQGMFGIGHRITLLEKFDAAETIRILADPQRGITIFYGVPTLYARILEAAPPGTNFDHVRLFVSGSAPLPPAQKTAFADRFGKVILERWGMTETLMNVSQRIDEPRPAGEVGRPLLGVATKIVGPDGGTLRDGEEGEILVRGKNVFAGYFDDPAATAESFTTDGFFKTGDLGIVDPSTGTLRISGRKKELIISGGLKIHPREVEDCIALHPSVRESAVVGLPDADLGEIVAAAVVLLPGARLTADDLVGHCRAHLAAFKKPRLVVFVDALPRNSMGKLTRELVRRTLLPSVGS